MLYMYIRVCIDVYSRVSKKDRAASIGCIGLPDDTCSSSSAVTVRLTEPSSSLRAGAT